ncbi:MAG TPA: MupA/Atu3671 family FMN-dependent luciferase-like monooxygenase [Blastocatellia bacterium]|nr:MupA/Atu3671 family FMN-dependent luciferase-like monooxygenase [Blastocatellia bacterium]
MNEIIEQDLISRTGPLSYGQRALWFLQKLTPDSAAYNVILAARSDSAIDVPALRGAFQKLIDRHASLRTTFPAIKGKPVQQVRKHQAIDFRHVDVSTRDRHELMGLLVEESHRPFDLERGPVIRVSLFTRSGQEHVLLLTMHHIVVDFLSFAIILDELRALYAAERAAVDAGLPELATQYLDYADWQVEMLEGPRGEGLWDYWRKQLAGDLPALNLPTDRPRLQAQTFRGATQTFRLNEELTERLKSFAQAEGVSLFMALLAALQVLLHRRTGQREVLLGSPPVGARREDFQSVVGFFHNPVVIRGDLSGDPTFRTLLGRVRHTVLDALAHQDYPFPLLVERLQPARDPSRSPLFQAMFVFYESGDPTVLSFLAGEAGRRINLGGLELESLGLEQQASMLDLTMTVVDSEGRLAASLQYNTDLFDAATIDRMAEDFESLVSAAVADPQRRISDLPLSKDGLKDAWPGRAEQTGVEQTDEPAGRRMDFSLFYFATDEDEAARDKYKLLIEGAKFADRHGFSAVWTPERHFHAFGGLYPNPSVTGAAIAMVTERIQIRAGSVVLPLHSPIRVAEEWSVVDNLSNGRVGLSFASGWHADDFVFAPENFADRRKVMAGHIETVRRLWRGESLPFIGGAGNEVQVKILPRPVQRELPVWVTAFGSVETFQMAGEIGANMITHLLGQSVELVAEKIAIYRKAWRDHSHEGSGHVTLMLHTFVGEDFDAVREKVRVPFCNYLKSSLDLLIGLAKGAGLEVDPKHITEQNADALVTHAFNRYYETCGLFGTPDTCLRMVDKLKAAGIDEIACLIDFGVDAASVLSGLDHLNLVKEASNKRGGPRRRESAAAAPRTELEKTIAAVWREVVGVGAVGINDNFFDLGGSPILMEKIHSRLEMILNRNISMMDMFKYMTVSSLAKHLSSDQAASAPLQEMQGRAETRRALMRRKQRPRAGHTG